MTVSFEQGSRLGLLDGDALDDYVIEWLVAAVGCNGCNLVYNLAAYLVGNFTEYGVLAPEPAGVGNGDEDCKLVRVLLVDF